MSANQFASVALSRVAGVGPKLYRLLVGHFGDPTAVISATPQELREVPGMGDKLVAAVLADRPRREAEMILDSASAHGIDVLCTAAKGYPPPLKNIVTAPPVLYHYGETDFTNPHRLAVIGTREMSQAGGRQVERLLDPLEGYAPLVVSGLAYGVDIAAHRRALHLGLPTLAVMGSGHGHVYPYAHRSVALRMAERGGGVLTEYPYWIKPQREYFPARNRIVALLAAMTVIVESGERGGSMITANMAHEYGRPVGACPGRGGDARSAGCNKLIKTGRAHLIEDGRDVVEVLNWKGASSRARQTQLFTELSPEERGVVGELERAEVCSIDDFHRKLGNPPAQLASTLLMLEVKGIIASLPGHRYRLCS